MWWIALRKHANRFALVVINRHWDGAGSWNPVLSKTRNRLSDIVNTMIIWPHDTRNYDISNHFVGRVFWGYFGLSIRMFRGQTLTFKVRAQCFSKYSNNFFTAMPCWYRYLQSAEVKVLRPIHDVKEPDEGNRIEKDDNRTRHGSVPVGRIEITVTTKHTRSVKHNNKSNYKLYSKICGCFTTLGELSQQVFVVSQFRIWKQHSALYDIFCVKK